MPEADINLVAILAAALASMAIGFAWYTALSEPWMKAIGKKRDELGGANTGYALTALAWVVMAYVLSHFVDYAGADTLADGLQTGFWAWLGFVATTLAVNYIFGQRSRQLYVIDAGHFLAILLAQGAILATWQ
jgi:hypothetical protein